jgi:hypothetical protein
MPRPLSDPSVTIHVVIGYDKLQAFDSKIASQSLPRLGDRSKVIKRLIDLYLEGTLNGFLVRGP